MKFKNGRILVLLGSILLTGCNSDPKIALTSNSDFLLYGEVSDDHLFYKPTLEEFTNLYNSGLTYIILFSQDGCPACEQFAPIIKEYIKNEHQLVVSVDGPDKYKIEEEYGSVFFADSLVQTPSVFVKENNDKIYNVDYHKYFKTYIAFKRHMNSRYKTAKYSYFCGEIAGKNPIFSSFTKVDFTTNDVFKNSILPKAISSQNNVVFSSNFKAQSLSIINNDFSIAKSDTINDNLTEEIINKYL